MSLQPQTWQSTLHLADQSVNESANRKSARRRKFESGPPAETGFADKTNCVFNTTPMETSNNYKRQSIPPKSPEELPRESEPIKEEQGLSGPPPERDTADVLDDLSQLTRKKARRKRVKNQCLMTFDTRGYSKQSKNRVANDQPNQSDTMLIAGHKFNKYSDVFDFKNSPATGSRQSTERSPPPASEQPAAERIYRLSDGRLTTEQELWNLEVYELPLEKIGFGEDQAHDTAITQWRGRWMQTKRSRCRMWGNLFYEKAKWNDPQLLLVPQKWIPRVLWENHDSPEAGHPLIHATITRLRKRYSWPTMWDDVRQHVISCTVCAQQDPPLPEGEWSSPWTSPPQKTIKWQTTSQNSANDDTKIKSSINGQPTPKPSSSNHIKRQTSDQSATSDLKQPVVERMYRLDADRLVSEQELWKFEVYDLPLHQISFKEHQENDEEIKVMREQHARPGRSGYILCDGILYRQKEFGDSRILLVPREWIPRVIWENHNSAKAGHPWINETVARIRKRYAWSTMWHDVEQHILDCSVCARKSTDLPKGEWSSPWKRPPQKPIRARAKTKSLIRDSSFGQDLCFMTSECAESTRPAEAVPIQNGESKSPFASLKQKTYWPYDYRLRGCEVYDLPLQTICFDRDQENDFHVNRMRELAESKRKTPYRLVNNILYWQSEPDAPLRLVVPQKWAHRVVRENHDDAGHPDVYDTSSRVSRKYYWPDSWTNSKNRVLKCKVCRNDPDRQAFRVQPTIQPVKGESQVQQPVH